MISVKTAFFASLLTAAVPFYVMATEKPPADGKRINEIVETLETSGYDTITEVEYDDDRWEAEAYKDGEKYKVKLDAATGEITSVEH